MRAVKYSYFCLFWSSGRSTISTGTLMNPATGVGGHFVLRETVYFSEGLSFILGSWLLRVVTPAERNRTNIAKRTGFCVVWSRIFLIHVRNLWMLWLSQWSNMKNNGLTSAENSSCESNNCSLKRGSTRENQIFCNQVFPMVDVVYSVDQMQEIRNSGYW